MILIFGSNGMLGNYITRVLNDIHYVIPLSRTDFDIEIDPWTKLFKLLDMYRPTVIVNCSGLIPQRNIDLNKPYYRINAVFPHKLQFYCDNTRHPCKLIHITTDCVFSGKKGNYHEWNCPDPGTIYGRSKYFGEPWDACVIRTSIIGEEIVNKKSLLEWVRAQKHIAGYLNYIWNGVTCLKLSEIVKEIIKTNCFWKGIRHIHSPRNISKFELCNMINDVYELDIEIIKSNAEVSTDRTLMTLYPMFSIEPIEDQLKKQKEFQLCAINT